MFAVSIIILFINNYLFLDLPIIIKVHTTITAERNRIDVLNAIIAELNEEFVTCPPPLEPKTALKTNIIINPATKVKNP